MAEEIRDLIEKINQEGIKAAEEKAYQIESAAKQKADQLLEKAKLEAERMLAEARKKISQDEQKEKTLLAQAGRDMLLALREEINAMLGRILLAEIRQAFSPEFLFDILKELIKSHSAKHSADIEVLLKKEDLEILEKRFLAKLKDELKKGIVLKPAEEISGGFTISFDNGKSCYDFTDQALAEYIGNYLKPKLAELLKTV